MLIRNGYTPINIASANENLEIVEYLYETCHANVRIKEKTEERH